MQTSTGELIRRRCSGRPHHGDEYLATPSPTPGIQFCHPAYDDLSCALFWIPGHDSLDHGLHHETARLICGLIADNRSGWFTTERDGKRIDTPQDGLLKLEQYYFRVSDDYAEKYAVVPTFSHWTFPHGNLPEFWKNCTGSLKMDWSATYTTLAQRDETCRLSNHFERTEQAHLVPQKEELWFNRNMMGKYRTSNRRPDDHTTKSLDNMILLRSDIHGLFDQQQIAFLPKPAQDTDQYSMVAHILVSSRSTELVDLYHNVPLLQLTNIPLEYLFARFAWSVMPLLSTFLRQGSPRVLSVIEATGKKTKICNGDECIAFSTLNRARTVSPKKRKQDQTGEDETLEDISSEIEDTSSEIDGDEADRGRKRRRSSSFTWRSSFKTGTEVDIFPSPVIRIHDREITSNV